jgi:hypothetical protein
LSFCCQQLPFTPQSQRIKGFSPADIAKITRTCRQAIGYPVATEQNLWLQLTPFLCNKAEHVKEELVYVGVYRQGVFGHGNGQ